MSSPQSETPLYALQLYTEAQKNAASGPGVVFIAVVPASSLAAAQAQAEQYRRDAERLREALEFCGFDPDEMVKTAAAFYGQLDRSRPKIHWRHLVQRAYNMMVQSGCPSGAANEPDPVNQMDGRSQNCY